jgi:hypothetical protein
MKAYNNKHRDSLFKRLITGDKWNKIHRFEQEQRDRDDAIESVVRPILRAYAQTIQSEARTPGQLTEIRKSLTRQNLEADENLRILKLRRSNRKLLKTSKFTYENELLNAEVEARVLAGKVLLVWSFIGRQRAAEFSLLRRMTETGQESVQLQEVENAILEQRRRSSVSSASSASYRTAASAATQGRARYATITKNNGTQNKSKTSHQQPA